MIMQCQLLIVLSHKEELSAYEQNLYNQLCVTAKVHSRLMELEMIDYVRNNQAKGGSEPQDTDTAEHRTNYPDPEI